MIYTRVNKRVCLASSAECNRRVGRRYTRILSAQAATLVIAAMVFLWPSPTVALDAGDCPQTPVETVAPSQPQPVVYGEGLLWRVSVDGVEPSYLFGTIHLDDERVLELPEPVRQALDGARRLVLEVDFDDQARRAFSSASRSSDHGYLARSLPPSIFRELLEIAASRYRLPQSDVVGLRPWALFTLFGRPPSRGRLVLDEFLRQSAVRGGKQVFGLETVAEMVGALDGMAAADQLDILVDAVCNHDRLEQQLQKMVSYYLARDLAGMMAFNSSGHVDEALFQRLMQHLLYARNLRMIDRVEGHLENGGAFVAVGALHLPGKRGLLAQLEALGYRVERVY